MVHLHLEYCMQLQSLHLIQDIIQQAPKYQLEETSSRQGVYLHLLMTSPDLATITSKMLDGNEPWAGPTGLFLSGTQHIFPIWTQSERNTVLMSLPIIYANHTQNTALLKRIFNYSFHKNYFLAPSFFLMKNHFTFAVQNEICIVITF